jgi:hypothetical protein
MFKYLFNYDSIIDLVTAVGFLSSERK